MYLPFESLNLPLKIDTKSIIQQIGKIIDTNTNNTVENFPSIPEIKEK